MIPGRQTARVLFLAVVLGAAVWWLPPVLSVPGVVLGVLLLNLDARRSVPVPSPPSNAPPAVTEATLAEVIAPLAEGVVLLDGAEAVVAANTAAAAIVGRPLDSMAGASLIQALRDHGLAEVVRRRDAFGVATAVRVSATGHDVLATASPVQGAAVRVLLVIEDVTELERVRRARAELVSNMSHELRTPVSAARALAETLQAGVDEADERQRFLDRLVAEIVRLGEMVDRLLRLSRLESGADPFADERIEAVPLFATAAQRIAPLARRRGVIIDSGAAGMPPVPDARGDRERVLEVLSNLLDNAVRHSPQGGHVWLTAVTDDDDVRFEVRDEGPGILPSDRGRVFERFYTGDEARAAGGGSGLGLSIALHLVQRMGGRIWVAERTPGATIAFTLPAYDRSDAPPA